MKKIMLAALAAMAIGLTACAPSVDDLTTAQATTVAAKDETIKVQATAIAVQATIAAFEREERQQTQRKYEAKLSEPKGFEIDPDALIRIVLAAVCLGASIALVAMVVKWRNE
jgi:hypothetical protein